MTKNPAWDSFSPIASPVRPGYAAGIAGQIAVL
jgi:hypothetical protein